MSGGVQQSSSGSRGWDPFKTYNATIAEQKAVQERAQMRLALKKEWQQKVTSPHRGVRGFIFDPAVQRFLSMRYDHWDHFKSTPRTALVAFGLGVAPVIFFTWWITTEKRDREEKFRKGEVAYADRMWKFV